MQNIYGVVSGGVHTDTSKTERGAKIYATKKWRLDNQKRAQNSGKNLLST